MDEKEGRDEQSTSFEVQGQSMVGANCHICRPYMRVFVCKYGNKWNILPAMHG